MTSSTLNSLSSVISPNTTGDPLQSTSPSEPIFLQTKLAQGIAGTFVWAALFLTCQQVKINNIL